MTQALQVNKRTDKVSVTIERRDRTYLMYVDDRLIGAASTREQALEFLSRRLEAIA